MRFFTLLSVLFPILAGSALLIWRPVNRKTRNAYSMCVVLIGSFFVLGSVGCAWKFGSAATAVHIFSLSDKLELAFRVDGASMVFGSIIGVLWPITTAYAFSYMKHEGRENRFFGFFIISYGVLAGIAFSANFFNMYFFYELMTLSTLPLVMHEMDGKARSAGKKYLIYSIGGAALAFIAIIYLIEYGNNLDFCFGGLLNPAKLAGHETELRLIFVLGFFGFGVKAALFPLYDWLPSASVAPTPVTALLHAVAVVKSGAFAVMRLIYYGFGTELLSGTWAQGIAVSVAAFTIAYGGAMALRERHLKRRLAYSTVSNLSYILLAFALMSQQGLTGGLLHMVYHAVIKITLFFCAGSALCFNGLEYLRDMEGLHKRMPITCACFTFAALALMGLPPLGGFISKWTIGVGCMELGSWMGYLGAAALITSSVLTALYMMTAIVRFYFPLKDSAAVSGKLREADWAMKAVLIVMCIVILYLSLVSDGLIKLLSLVGGVL